MPNKPPKGPVKKTTLRDNLLSMFAPRMDAAMPSNNEQSPSSFDEYANLSNRYNPSLYSDDELLQINQLALKRGPYEQRTTDMDRNRLREAGQLLGYSNKEMEAQYNRFTSPQKQASQDSMYNAAAVREMALKKFGSPEYNRYRRVTNNDRE
jgi:hypothetical protein